MWEFAVPLAAIITSIAAIIGIIYAWHKSRYRMKLQFTTLIPGYTIPEGKGYKPGAPCLGLEGMNIGERTITLSSWGFGLPDGTYMTRDPRLIPIKFPYELLPGKSVQVWMEYKELAGALKNGGYSGKICFNGFFKDQIGHKFSVKSKPFDVEEFLQLP